MAIVTTILACSSDQPRDVSAESISLRVHAAHHASLKSLGTDTLSDLAQVSDLSVDPGGDAVVTIVRDPERSVTAALIISNREGNESALLWPDSVTRAWWPAPHRLAFTTQTGDGIRIIVDVHAADLIIADTMGVAAPRDTEPWTPSPSLTQRAQSYVDSAYAQVGGSPQGSALRYRIGRYLPAPEDSLVAFHVTGSISGGVESNPAWFIMNRSTTVSRVDHVIGLATELPAEAAAWGQGSFYYAKGQALWRADIEQ